MNKLLWMKIGISAGMGVIVTIVSLVVWQSSKANLDQSVAAWSAVKLTGKGSTNLITLFTDKEYLEKQFPDNMNDYDMENAIHEMSHQKVEADVKWGWFPLTKEAVDRLLYVTEHSSTLEHQSLYLHILTRWQKGDFSQADDDHNAVWRLLDGTIGEATGIATPEEEQQFVNQQLAKHSTTSLVRK